MRLGQLARKHDIPVQDILSYLEDETGEKFHANAKLFDAIEDKIFAHFDLQAEEPVVIEPQVEEESNRIVDEEIKEVESEINEDTKPATAADDIASVDGEIELAETPDDSKEQPVLADKKEVEVNKIQPKEDEVIQTDKLLELLESEENSPDLEKIKLIKAPKKELSGLKVLGKVELPEPKKKEISEKEKEASELQRAKRPSLSEEEREKRRLKAKQKREAYQAREEKRRKEQEIQRLKELKAAHYKKKLQKPQPIKKLKTVSKDNPITTENIAKEKRPEPKTWLGKWWRWMNT